ncbi:MAG TPA: cytochrome b/b6 domain-containing protein [Gammaproteobacteria bacterium]|jgi:cytochrome b561
MRLKDTATGYGWISILLHWVTAVLILYLLYLGSTIGSLEPELRSEAILRHTSVAIVSYVLLVARVVWRIVYPHPGPTPEQRGWAHTAGKWTHYAMLVAIAAMLISGPLMQFSYGRDIQVFDWFVIPTPIDASFGLAAFLHRVHTYAAIFIFVALVLHVGGVYKHTAFNQDGTLAKIIIPGRQSGEAAESAGGPGREGEP